MRARRPKLDSRRGMNISLYHYRFQTGWLSDPASHLKVYGLSARGVKSTPHLHLVLRSRNWRTMYIH
jgi:hypothetical protein